jgi:hypothetical protein
MGLLILSLSCSAPRDNPLDPASPYYAPPQPPESVDDLAIDSLDNLRCRITWTAPRGASIYLLYSSLPDWDGSNTGQAIQYSGELPGVRPVGIRQKTWIDLPPGQTRGWAIFSRSSDGLLSAASNILVIPAPRYNHPGAVTVQANSIYITQWSGLDRIELEITATIADSDTVDHVWVEFEGEEVGILSPVGDGLTWRKRFGEGLLPGANIEAFVGHPLSINYYDRAGFQSKDATATLVRIIRSEPEWISPAPNDTVSTTRPLLSWTPFDAEFDFSYSVEIWHVPQSDPDDPQLVYSVNGISSAQNEHQVLTDLPTDLLFLYWTLIVEDEFGNRSVSLESNFRIIP